MFDDIFVAECDDAGVRLDVFLAGRLGGSPLGEPARPPQNRSFTRSAVSKLIDERAVFVESAGRRLVPADKASYKMQVGDRVAVEFPEFKPPDALPENIALDVVFEDADIIIVNKARGIVVHPAPGHYSGTLVNALLHRCGDLSGINGVLRPGIVHRLDRDTSGLIAAAKNDTAHNALAKQLAERTMKRTYLLVAAGGFNDDEGVINKPIARDPKHRKKMSVQPNGRAAVTRYKVLERFKGFTLLEAALETGRTHQIRVHFASVNRPLLGDVIYGAQKQPFGATMQMLHAAQLGLIHPNGERMEFSVPPDDYFLEMMGKIRKM